MCHKIQNSIKITEKNLDNFLGSSQLGYYVKKQVLENSNSLVGVLEN